MQIKLSNATNWNDMISTFTSRTFHDNTSVIKVEYEMIYKHHAYVDSDKQ